MEAIVPRRPDPATPSAWEAALLQRRRLTLSTLESALPVALAAGEDFVAAGAGGDPICSVYSWAAFDDLLGDMDPGQTVGAYLLPHLPLEDASALQDRLAAGNAGFRVCNGPRLLAKMAARAKLLRVRDELAHLGGPLQVAMAELITRCNLLAPILEAGQDDNFGDAAAAVPLDIVGVEHLLARWGTDLEEMRALATAARRRVILAVHLAVFTEVFSGVLSGGDDLHTTIMRLAPELHERIFGNPRHHDPCADPPYGDDELERREKRTDIALQQLMREVGLEMKPSEFVDYSLEKSRRDLIELEGDVTRLELRLVILQPLHNATLALSSVQSLDQELLAHLNRPTLLGSTVSEEMPNTVMPFFPHLADLSEEDLRKEVRRNFTASF